MPDYRIKTPRGTYRITAPDDETAKGIIDDILRQDGIGAQTQQPAPAAQTNQPNQPEGFFDYLTESFGANRAATERSMAIANQVLYEGNYNAPSQFARVQGIQPPTTAAEKVAEFIGSIAGGTYPSIKDTLAGGAIGAVGGSVIPGIGTGVGAVGGMMGAGAGSARLGTFGQLYEDAIKQGFSPEEAYSKANVGSELSFGMGAIASGIGAVPLTKPAASVGMTIAKEALAQAGAQSAIGGADQAVQNIYAKESGIDPNRQIGEGVLKAAAGEAIFSPVEAGVQFITRDGAHSSAATEPTDPPPKPAQPFRYDVGDKFTYADQEGKQREAAIVALDEDNNVAELATEDGTVIARDMATIQDSGFFKHIGRVVPQEEVQRVQPEIPEQERIEEFMRAEEELDNQAIQKQQEKRALNQIKKIADTGQLPDMLEARRGVDQQYDEAVKSGNMKLAEAIDRNSNQLVAKSLREEADRVRGISQQVASSLDKRQTDNINAYIDGLERMANDYLNPKQPTQATQTQASQMSPEESLRLAGKPLFTADIDSTPRPAAPKPVEEVKLTRQADTAEDLLTRDVKIAQDMAKKETDIESRYKRRVEQAYVKYAGDKTGFEREVSAAKKARESAMRYLSPSDTAYTKATQGKSISEFVEDRGGIVDYDNQLAGEFSFLEGFKPTGKASIYRTADKFTKRGRRAKGLPPDDMAQALVDAGYLKERDINKMIEAIDEDVAARRGASNRQRIFSSTFETARNKADLVEKYESVQKVNQLRDELYKALGITEQELMSTPARVIARRYADSLKNVEYGDAVDTLTADQQIDDMADQFYSETMERDYEQEFTKTQVDEPPADVANAEPAGRAVEDGERQEQAPVNVAPERTYEQGATGDEQAVIPGAERISDRELAERKMSQPLRAAARQKAADEGLFDTGARQEQELPIQQPQPATGIRRWFQGDYAKRMDDADSLAAKDTKFSAIKSEVEDAVARAEGFVQSKGVEWSKAHYEFGPAKQVKDATSGLAGAYDRLILETKRVASGSKIASDDKLSSAYQGVDRELAALNDLLRDGEEMYAFAGANAADANAANLDSAMARLAEGADAETVRKETGWFRGDDGKLRYEISDDAAKMRQDPETLFQDDNEVIGETVRLGDVLEHPRLFAAYPQLSNMEVSFRRINDSGYNDKEGRLIIGTLGTGKGGVLSRILHEAQHYIQRREGFAIGSSIKRAGSVEAYKRSAGEIEARNVQARQKMTEAQRREVSPEQTRDIDANEAVVEFSDGSTAPAPDALIGGYTPEAAGQIELIKNEVIKTIRRIAGGDVLIETPQQIGEKLGNRIRGTYFGNMIRVALGMPDAVGAGRHEAAHFLEDIGAIPANELNMLKNMAKNEWIKKYGIDTKYDGFSDDVKQSEAWVAAYEDWANNNADVSGPVKKIFLKLREFFGAVFNAMLGRGFMTPQSIFRNIESGRYATREGSVVSVEGQKIDFNDNVVAAKEFEMSQNINDAMAKAGQMQLGYADDAKVRYSLQNPQAAILTASNGYQNKDFLIGWRSKFADPRTVARYGGSKSFLVYNNITNFLEASRHVMNVGHDLAFSIKKLSLGKQDKFNKLMDAYKISRQRVVYAPGPIVIKVPANAAGRVGPDSLVKAGEVVRIDDPEIIEAFYAHQRLMDFYADRFVGNMVAAYTGYTGPIDLNSMQVAIAAAAANPKAQKKLQKAYDFVKTMRDENVKEAYVPSIRPGDWMIKVTERDQNGMPITVYRKHMYAGALSNLLPFLRNKEVKVGQAKFVMPANVEKEFQRIRDSYKGRNVTFDVQEVTKDNADNLDLDALERATLQLSGKISQQSVDEILDKLFDARTSGWRRKSADIPGYETDFVKADLDYIHQASSTIERIAHANSIADALGAIDRMPATDGGLARNVIKDYWTNWMKWVESPSHPLQALKTFSFVNHLGLNLKSGLVQFFSTPLTVIPNGSLIFGKANTLNRILPAIKDAIKTIDWEPTKKREGIFANLIELGRNQDEKAQLNKALRDGFLGATLARYMSGANFYQSVGGKQARVISEAVNGLGSMISFAESAQKGGVFIAAYRLAKEQPQVIKKNLERNFAGDSIAAEVLNAYGTKDFPYVAAKFAVEELMLVTNLENQSPIMRGNFLGGLGSLGLQFLNYPLKAIANIAGNAVNRGPAGKRAAVFALMMLWAASGVMGLPFAEDAAEDLVGFLSKYLKRNVNLDMELREIVDSMTGIEGAGELVTRGPIRQNLGVDINQSLGLGNIVPGLNQPFVETLMGAPYAALVNLYNMITGSLGIGSDSQKYEGVIDSIMQNFPVAGVRNAYQGAVVWPREGVVNGRGGNVLMPSEISGGEAAAKSLGFTPSAVTQAREQQYYLGQVRRDYYDRAEAQYWRAVNAMALMMDYQRQGDRQRASEERARVAEAIRNYGSITGRPINIAKAQQDAAASTRMVEFAKLRSLNDPLLLKQIVESSQLQESRR